MDQILTDEKAIKEAIKQPTAYAIYSLLYKTRDPGMWQRIFDPYPAQHSTTLANTPQQHPAVRETSPMRLARKVGRALRFMLAVPDDAELKTYSSSHVVTYQSRVAVLGPNIPSRQQHMCESTIPYPYPSPRRNLPPAPKEPKPGTNAQRSCTVLNDTARASENAIFTPATRASLLNVRVARSPRTRGYAQGAFVTVLDPRIFPSLSEKTPGCDAVRPTPPPRPNPSPRPRPVGDEESEVTVWPGANF